MSAIEPGDLVICVHAHCDRAANSVLGRIKRVAQVRPAPVLGKCRYCGASNLGPYPTLLAVGSHFAYPLPWVRKIEPLTKKEEVSEVMDAIAPGLWRWKNPVHAK